MKGTFLAVVSAAGLLLATTSYAQEHTPEKAPKRTAEEVAKNYSEKMTKELGLTPEQAAQFDKLCLSHIKQQRAQREAMREQHEKMTRRMKEILTPEQYAKWKEGKHHIPGHKAHHKGHHGKHHSSMQNGACQTREKACRKAEQRQHCKQDAASCTASSKCRNSK